MSWRDILKAPLNPRELAEAQEFAGEEITEENKKLKDNYRLHGRLEDDLNLHLSHTNWSGGFKFAHQYEDYFKPDDPEFKLFKEFLSPGKYADIERAKELYEELLKIPASRMEKPHRTRYYPDEDEQYEGI
mgnify:CR=1 FL=1